MRYLVLGPLEVTHEGRRLPVDAARQQAVLAVLLLRPQHLVTADELVDAVWERPPQSARSNIRTYIATLRRTFRDTGDERIHSTGQYYRLDLGTDELDLAEYDGLVAQAADARRAGDPARALDLYGRADRLWRGVPFIHQSLGPALRGMLAGLSERRQQAIEDAIDCRLDLGRHAELIGDIQAQLAVEPYRETLWAQLVLALYRSGRRAEALLAYGEARQLLVTELGVEPGHELRRLQAEILAAREAGQPGMRSLPAEPVRAR